MNKNKKTATISVRGLSSYAKNVLLKRAVEKGLSFSYVVRQILEQAAKNSSKKK